MLTTKNWGGRILPMICFGLAMVLQQGCQPPGPKALLAGERLIREGKYAEAAEKLKAATELLPQNAQAWNHLGLALHGAGRPGEAMRAYQQALALNRNLAAARFNLGSLLLEQNLYAEAASEFTTFTALEPNSFQGWVKLGTAQRHLRKLDDAEKSFFMATRIQGQNAECLNGLGLIQMQKKKPQEAFKYFVSAQQKQPGYGPAVLNQAIVAQQYFNNKPLALQKYSEYARLTANAPDATPVASVIAQLQAELAPRPAPVPAAKPTNAPPARPANPLPLVTNIPAPPPPPATNTLAPKTEPPPAAVVRTQAVAAPLIEKPAAKTNAPRVTPLPPQTKPAPPTVVKEPAAPRPNPVPEKTNAAPKAVAPPAREVPKPRAEAPVVNPAPALKPRPADELPITEVERVKDDFAITPARDLPAASGRAPSPQLPAAKPAPGPTNRALVARPIQPEEKPGILDRMNPKKWFKAKTDSAAPRESASRPAPTPSVAARQPGGSEVLPIPRPAPGLPQPAPSEPRYVYHPISHPPGDRPAAEAFFAQGAEAQSAKRMAAAIESYQKAVRLDPSYFDAWSNLGQAAYESKDLPLALASFENAVMVNPASADARYNFAVLLQRANYFQDAAAQYQEMLDDNPSEVRAHLALGNLYSQQLRQPEKARAHYLKALELNPRHPEAGRIRAWLSAPR